ncbi:MAG: hypothetical protein M3Q36_03540 [bacterium]|nr:hypothetical protein [bacterium]
MHKLNQQGSLLIPLVLVVLVLFASAGFGAWAYMGRQDYKNNTDAKIEEAVEVANEKLSDELNVEFAELQKNPNNRYKGPVAFSTLQLVYPRTWSAYIDEGDSRATKIFGYFHPKFVPATDSDTSFAFRFEVESKTYDVIMRSVESSVKSGKVKVSAYRAPKVKTALGSRVEGEIINKKQGVMVILPVRDKTIKIWTEGDTYRGDFEKILSQLSFVP